MDRSPESDRSASGPNLKSNIDSYLDHSVSVEEHGSERGDQRFPRDERPPPRTSTWRNNLTALSQHRNLYFVAYSQHIHVYRPGHCQTIGSEPALILAPVMKKPQAPGYLSPQIPHAINHILVGDLGSEEILLIATDSGNVTAYRTERIFSTIERNQGLENNDATTLGSQVECFFSEWVGQSAWGLAIHKLGRIIAVSSNTTVVTVFAFALVNDSDYLGGYEAEFDLGNPKIHTNEWLHVGNYSEFVKIRSWTRQHRRARNVRLSLMGHIANIPNVSFLNSELDPHGDWLLSTDINNKLLVWKIWERSRPVSHWGFYPPAGGHHPDDIFDDRQRGWNVMALDPRIFRVKRNPAEACGGPPHRYPNEQAPYDLSFLAGRVPDATQYYDFFRPPGQPFDINNGLHGQGPPSDESFSLSSSDSSDSSDSGSNFASEVEEEGSIPPTVAQDPHVDPAATTNINPIDLSSPATEQAGPLSVAVQLTGTPDPNPPDMESMPSNMDTVGNMDDLADLENDEYSDDGDDYPHVNGEENEETGPGMEFDDGYSQHGTDSSESLAIDSVNFSDYGDADILEPGLIPYVDPGAILPTSYTMSSIDPSDSDSEDEAGQPQPFSDFPILHFSESHIRMLPGPFARGPSVIFRAALSQVVTHHIPSIESCDRFNMVQQVPELGVVIAASQKGRVAIMGLTEVPGKGKMFRIDRILPFASQERRQLRPLCPLLGIAVGPVESHLIPVEGDSAEDDNDDDDDDDTASDSISSTGAEFGDYNCREFTDSSEGLPRPSSSEKQKGKSRDTRTRKAHPIPIRHIRTEGVFKREKWHGIEYSRRYRLLLMYCDHTIMHYELYYDWPRDVRGSQNRLSYGIDRPFILKP